MLNLVIYTKYNKVPSAFDLFIGDMSAYWEMPRKVMKEDWNTVQCFSDVSTIYEKLYVRLSTTTRRSGKATILLGGEDWEVHPIFCNEKTQILPNVGCMCY